MGNLRQKYTDEEWERLVENIDKKNQYPVAPEECFITEEGPITNLIKALKTDEDYYQDWKVSIAMAFQDEFHSHRDGDIDIDYLANAAAERFLRQLVS